MDKIYDSVVSPCARCAVCWVIVSVVYLLPRQEPYLCCPSLENPSAQYALIAFRSGMGEIARFSAARKMSPWWVVCMSSKRFPPNDATCLVYISIKVRFKRANRRKSVWAQKKASVCDASLGRELGRATVLMSSNAVPYRWENAL